MALRKKRHDAIRLALIGALLLAASAGEGDKAHRGHEEATCIARVTCERGNCGRCQCRVRKGERTTRDLEPLEGLHSGPCSSLEWPARLECDSPCYARALGDGHGEYPGKSSLTDIGEFAIGEESRAGIRVERALAVVAASLAAREVASAAIGRFLEWPSALRERLQNCLGL